MWVQFLHPFFFTFGYFKDFCLASLASLASSASFGIFGI